ncbi:hypothetical protein SAY86_029488 [Trapa natans]|uniref:Response regulatory domain-containing protein n=1 Tax=Trapa natans TaxID=22666 RepID=A0AAN7RBZ1_TRANT|nr:hypothetical protein SAY86_029488 [Trapa natans]
MEAESQFHVLAVDDSIIDRKLVEKLLKNSSYQELAVTTVDSGSKALEFLGFREHEEGEEEEEARSSSDSPPVSPNYHQEVEVNLIITDYCMPGMTGYDLLKKIKARTSLCTILNIPVVIMSSENVPSRISRCLEEGAEEFFLKPLKLSDVNRLRPHLMRTKLMHPNQQEEGGEVVDNKHEIQQQNHHHQEEQPGNNSSNKRKAMEEGLSVSPDRTRTRPRYSGVTTVII